MLGIPSPQSLLTAEHEQNLSFPVIWIQPKMGEDNTLPTPTPSIKKKTPPPPPKKKKTLQMLQN